MKLIKDEYGEEQLTIENEDDYMIFAEAFQRLQERAAPIATAMNKLYGRGGRIDPDEIYMEDGLLFYDYDEGCCGCYETHSELIPSSYLFDPEWLEDAKATIAAKEEEERQKAERKRLKAEADRKEREYKQYLKLKEQYEGGF